MRADLLRQPQTVAAAGQHHVAEDKVDLGAGGEGLPGGRGAIGLCGPVSARAREARQNWAGVSAQRALAVSTEQKSCRDPMKLTSEQSKKLREIVSGIPQVAEKVAAVPMEGRKRASDAAEQSYRQTMLDSGFAEPDARRWASAVAIRLQRQVAERDTARGKALLTALYKELSPLAGYEQLSRLVEKWAGVRNDPLPNVITPKSAPLSPMKNLIEAKQAILNLPRGYLQRPHWLAAGRALLAAAETGRPADLQRVYDAIVVALDTEGWLSLSDRRQRKSRSTDVAHAGGGSKAGNDETVRR